MTRKHKIISKVTMLVTLLAVSGLAVYGIKVHGMRQDIEREIADQKAALDEKEQNLSELKTQYEQMDSEEYIRKIATEELGMVDRDTIVFQIKN